MVAGKSPEWLPSGFIEKVKYKNGRKIKHYYNVATGAKYLSKKDVLLSATSDDAHVVTPQTKTGDDNDKGLSSNSKVEAIDTITNGFPEWLPNGWIMDEKERQSGARAGEVYKVYTELSSGNKFYSRAAVTRYLNTLDHADTPSVQNKIANVDEPSADMSLQHKSMTNTESIPEKKRKGNSFRKIASVDEPSPDMSPQHKSMTNTESIPEKKRKGNSFKKLDNVDEPSPDTSVQHKSMNNSESIPEKRENSSKTLGNVNEPSPDTSLKHKSMRNTESIPEKKRKGNLFQTVTTVTTAAEDLPPGWIKEIKTSKSGKKIRKDPYYTDPVSGYVFRSKPDALRYLKTNDIGSCLCRPFKRELDDLKLIKNEIPPSAPSNGKLSQEQKLLLFGPDSDGGESSGTKTPAESELKISEQPQDDDNNNNNEADSCEISNNKNAEIENNPKQENEPSNKIPETPCPDLNKKSKKRKSFTAPSRASKRLAGAEPEMQPNPVMNECALSDSAKKSSESEEEVDADIPPGFSLEPSDSEELDIPPGFSLPSKIEPAKDAVENTHKNEENQPKNEEDRPKNEENRPKNEENQPKNEENRPKNEENQPKYEENRPKNEENQPSEEKPMIPEDEDKRAQEPTQLCYDFGDSWSDPLEFALKTLRGEISIDDNLAFPGCFDDIPYNNNNNNNNQVGPDGESSKQNGGVDLLRDNSPLFDINFPSCSEFNSQSSAEASRKDSQTKFNP